MLEKLFTKEKIEACQEMIDTAKASFFDAAQADMDAINVLSKDKKFENDNPGFCRQLYRPVRNIRGQAKIFGFPLIDRICGYLEEYCESSASSQKMTARDVFLIGKLVEALQRAFEQKIVDEGGAIEKELIDTIEKARSSK
jgi:chemotaxis protein histidine kinase CheA